NQGTAIIDAHDHFGQVASVEAMNKAMTLAKEFGISIVTVKNSSHFGIAGYYAQMAAKQDLIGLAMTNTAPLVVPTGGCQAVIGTNPLAVSVPTKTQPWSMDCAQSIVPRGRIEVAERNQETLPPEWAVDGQGQPCTDPTQVLKGLANRSEGGICPLGGHKGYGLIMMIDILSGVLSGAGYGLHVDEHLQAEMGHCFIAIDIERFMPISEFKQRMQDFSEMLKAAAAPGQQVWLHGEIENQRRQENLELGIPFEDQHIEILNKIAEEYGLIL
ncbi:Ldh family oxidoreductase, partial [Patescibacteria group bacterium]